MHDGLEGAQNLVKGPTFEAPHLLEMGTLSFALAGLGSPVGLRRGWCSWGRGWKGAVGLGSRGWGQGPPGE